MEITYNWLLHNTGNESNYFTILNVQRHAKEGGTTDLEVMARTKEFEIVHLLIEPGSSTGQPVNLPDRRLKESHFFTDENQVVNYISSGQIINVEPSQQHIGVYVFTPTADAGEISFPSE